MSVGAELQPGDPSCIGPYRLVEILGSGGMGRVYLGRSAGGRQVAVKVIQADLAADPEFRARFRREVVAARMVSGLYTAAVIDADTEGRLPWLATAYINAPSLATAVQDGGPLPPTSLRALAAALAEGLSAIHAAGLVHRDLKPTNVLLAADGPRVIDFGIAYAAEASSLTGTNVVVGSPGYLSPEQAEAKREVGPASDVFSLGAVLCFAATGHGPWGTGSTAALIYRVVHAEPDLANVPDEIRTLVARCLVKKPEQRPTAAGILAELGDPELLSGWLSQADIYQTPTPAPPGPAPISAPAPGPADHSVTATLPPRSQNPIFARPPAARPARPARLQHGQRGQHSACRRHAGAACGPDHAPGRVPATCPATAVAPSGAGGGGGRCRRGGTAAHHPGETESWHRRSFH